MSYGDDLDRQIHAHLHTAGRHMERNNHDKAEQHYIAATQLSEGAGIPTWGRWTLASIMTREARHTLRERDRKIKNREVLA